MSIFALFIEDTIDIDAPVDTAWRALDDLGGWTRWNPFVVAVEGLAHPVVGGSARIHVRWSDGRGVTARQVVTMVRGSPGHKAFAWRFDGKLARLGLLWAERTMSLTELDARRCRFRSEELYTGPLAPLLPRASIRDGFQRMGVALKHEAARIDGGSRLGGRRG